MIFFFSGTGNSQYVANRIARISENLLESLNTKIKNQDFNVSLNGQDLIFVTPTYAWRIPRIVSTWIRNGKKSLGKPRYQCPKL